MKSWVDRYTVPPRRRSPVRVRYGDSVKVEPLALVTRVELSNQPGGTLSCWIQNRRSRFSPPVPVAGTVKEQSPSASAVHVAHASVTCAPGVFPEPSYNRRTTPATGPTALFAPRTPPTRTVMTDSFAPGVGTTAATRWTSITPTTSAARTALIATTAIARRRPRRDAADRAPSPGRAVPGRLAPISSLSPTRRRARWSPLDPSKPRC